MERRKGWRSRTGIIDLLTVTALFALPLKLAIAYIALFPAIAFWLSLSRGERAADALPPAIARPFIALVGVLFISSFFGIRPIDSLRGVASLTFFSLSAPMIAGVARRVTVPALGLVLVSGQAVAALHTAADAATGNSLPRMFLGAVTESGQLALVLPFAGGLLAAAFRSGRDAGAAGTLTAAIVGAAVGTLAMLAGFCRSLPAIPCSPYLYAGIGLLTIAGAIFAASRARLRNAWLLAAVLLPLLTSALLLNMKRGPWVGVFAAAVLYLGRFERRLLLPLFAASALAIFSLPPLQDRLAASGTDFFIAGGRSVMWDIGLELATRFPTGVGFENSDLLREFSPDIPPEHKHAHSNFLNIVLETGWLGLVVFVWWIAALIKYSLATRESQAETYLCSAIGCSFTAWQVAGLVEYNFGDSEVLLVVFALIGMLAALQAPGSPRLSGRSASVSN